MLIPPLDRSPTIPTRHPKTLAFPLDTSWEKLNRSYLSRPLELKRVGGWKNQELNTFSRCYMKRHKFMRLALANRR